MRATASLIVAGAALAAAGPALAHHSFASFDLTRLVRLDGVVAEFQWTNPHAWVELDVTRPDGEVERWGIEFNSPNNLTREGWSRHMLEPGDQVTFYVNPMRDGRRGGFYYHVVLPDGVGKTVVMSPYDPDESLDLAAIPSAYEAAP